MKLTNFIAALFAILIGGPFAWEMFDRTPPIHILKGITLPAEIERGSIFRIEWTIIPGDEKNCPGMVYRYLRDSAGNLWTFEPTPASFGIMPIGLGQVMIMGITHFAPPDATPGQATMYVRATYVCNFTQYLWPLNVYAPPVSTVLK